jgi:dsDNA-binding SOS-regulon protein
MAVQSLFFSDRDGMEKALSNLDTMLFATKAEADERDKMLELAEGFREFLGARVEGLDEQLADRIGVVLAENRELIKKALKKPDLLLQSEEATE